MMPSVVGTNMSQMHPHSYMGDPMLDELSTQLALAESIRRLSRASNGQRTSGTAMRVVKPSSASSSPQAMMARRRTLINDSNLARRRQQAWDQAAFQQMQDTSSCCANHQEPVERSSRPVSWHPGSHFQQPQMHMPMPQPDFSQYIMPVQMPYQQTDIYAGYQNLPPTPAAYSGHTSPTATFSPLTLPFAVSQPQTVPQYVAADAWNSTANFNPNTYTTNGSPGATEPFPTYITQEESFNWNPIPAQGYNCTAPPTPEEYQPIQQTQPEVAPEESIPYQPLEEPEEEEEEEGEILIGMGLYDPPSKADTDPELDNYRTTTSQLLDSTYRRGKGWKLEEAWEPPATEDEDDEDDADGEAQEEKDDSPESPPAEQSWI
ncbi:hypothetical protein F5X99DRAFT_319320 [Biscogniauxia marginata]|nr:hypothetical protein F5X99DRAFT_319320 [Biscogniauxia marginata]